MNRFFTLGGLLGLLLLFIPLTGHSSWIQDSIRIATLKAELKNNDRIAPGTLNNLAQLYLPFNYDSSSHYAHQAFNVAKETKNYSEMALAKHYLALNRMTWDKQVAPVDSLYKSGLQYARMQGDSSIVIRLLLTGGLYFRNVGSMPQAIDLYQRALRMARKLNSQDLEQQAIGAIGGYYYINKNHDKALDYFQQSLEMVRQLEKDYLLPSQFTNLGLVYTHLDRYEEAISALEKALQLAERGGQRHSMAVTLNALGGTYLRMGQPDQAVKYLEKGVTLCRELQLNGKLASMVALLAYIYTQQGDQELAEDYAREGLAAAQSADYVYMVTNLYRILSEIYKAQGNADGVYDALSKYRILQDSLLNAEKQRKIVTLEKRFEAAERELEIERLEQENEIARLWRYGLIGGNILIGVISMLLIWNFRSKARANRLKQKNAELHREQLQESLDHRNRQLTSHALHILHKNTMLQGLKDTISDLQKEEEHGTRALSLLSRRIDSAMHIDEDWENFKSYFDEVHPEFFNRLHQDYPDITNSELRHAALIRLGMSLKESASILNIAPESVKIARNRLKKKLSLEAEESVSQFLRSLG